MTSPATTKQQILEARIKLAEWLGEHGEENTKYIPLVEAVDLLDAALKPEPVR